MRETRSVAQAVQRAPPPTTPDVETRQPPRGHELGTAGCDVRRMLEANQNRVETTQSSLSDSSWPCFFGDFFTGFGFAADSRSSDLTLSPLKVGTPILFGATGTV